LRRSAVGVLIAPLLLAVVFVPMLVEARLAAANERAQRALGGIEPPGDVYRIMSVAYPAIFLAMIAEGALQPGYEQLAIGAAIFVGAKLLKWWAILTLGPAWTFRVIVRPDVPLVAAGPYRWLRHPNYVGVAGELAGVALMSGARVAGPVGTALFVVLMLRRIRVEERALSASGR
jgi:methyltransferase